jgi:hypothetical protein
MWRTLILLGATLCLEKIGNNTTILAPVLCSLGHEASHLSVCVPELCSTSRDVNPLRDKKTKDWILEGLLLKFLFSVFLDLRLFRFSYWKWTHIFLRYRMGQNEALLRSKPYSRCRGHDMFCEPLVPATGAERHLLKPAPALYIATVNTLIFKIASIHNISMNTASYIWAHAVYICLVT